MTTAATDVLTERQRQIEREGWTTQHDDEHDPGVLAASGAAYALNAADQMHPYSQGDGDNDVPHCWMFDPASWKPRDPRSDLVRAAALILAEIERIDRESPKGKT